MLGEQNLAIITGKGGVGRSALTAAGALCATGRGARVLALSMGDPAGLAAHLDVEGLGAEPRQVMPGLEAAWVDPAAALDEYLGLQLGRLPSRLAGRAFRALAETVPGVRDIVLMGKCMHEAQREDWDIVIVDGLPTGQIDSALGAPRTIADLVGRGPIHRQAARLHRRLADPTFTALIGVAAPEELALAELDDLAARLDVLGLVAMIGPVVNGVVPRPTDADPPSGIAGQIAATVDAIAQRHDALVRRRSAVTTIPRITGGATPARIAHEIAEALR